MTPPPLPVPGPDAERLLLRDTLATLAYRFEKAVRDVPPDYPDLVCAPEARSPQRLVAHIGDLLDWGLALADGAWRWAPRPATTWDADVQRVFDALAALDARLARPEPTGHPAAVLFRGPIADALTHVGQLALLRRCAGAPVRPESYARAEIAPGRVGRDQSAARVEFDGDASADRRATAPAPRAAADETVTS